MKKFIAISVVLACVAGSAFAQTRVTGALEYAWAAFQSSDITDSDVKPNTRTTYNEIYMQIDRTSDDVDAGALLRYRLKDDGNNHADYRAMANRAFMWWKPNDLIRLWFGRDDDGQFGLGDIVGWSYFRGSRWVSREGWDFGGAFIGNFKEGFAITLTPYMIYDGLTLNIATTLPKFSDQAQRNLEDQYPDYLQISAAIALDFGSIHLAWDGKEAGDHKDAIGFAFRSASLFDGISFEIGGAYKLTKDAEDPIQLAYGLVYDGGGWGLKSRMLIKGFDQTKVKTVEGDFVAKDFGLRFEVMPYYNFDFGSVFCNVKFVVPQSTTADYGWEINPYISKSVGSMNMRAGAIISNFNSNDGWGGGTDQIYMRLTGAMSFAF